MDLAWVHSKRKQAIVSLIFDFSGSTMSTEALLSIMGNSLSKKIPIQLDELTFLIRVFSTSNTFVYIKQFDISHESIKSQFDKKDFKEEVRKELFIQDANMVCNIPLFSYLMNKRNIKVIYKWVDINAKPIFEYNVNKVDCQKLK